MDSAGRRQKHSLYSHLLHFHFYILTIMKFSSIDYFVCYTFFYVYMNDNVLHLYQYHRFVAMEMLLLPQSVEKTFLFLRQASKPMTSILSYFHMLGAFFSSNCGRH
jgi:hypothetical protein